jgi:YHS domain-containing protein
LVPGRPALSVSHDGLTYRFADERARQAFLRQPERFLPVQGGRCPVTQVDRGEIRPGAPRWSVLFREHLFLCADEESRARFLKNPERYAHVAAADRLFCPHCWGRDGLRAQGAAAGSLAPAGWRSRPLEPGPLEARRLSSEALRR